MSLWLLLNGLLLLAAYLFGSFPTGYIVARKLKGIDIRQEGSGSTGATNVLRTVGKGPALVVFLVDILKGIAAIALMRFAYALPGVQELIGGTVTAYSWLTWMVILAGLGALLGHTKSIWINFKGGKAVATSLGVLFALNWAIALAGFGVFGIALACTRIVSLSSMLAAIALPGIMFAMHQPLSYQIFMLAASMYVIWLHRSNINRLLSGTEPRIGQKLPQPSESVPS
ncbi:glycerol-3-phosphate 1-O-acyltransferase PlsY [Oscillatoria acuminata]|uniref:Glycerol-3-phosphate acyltransferase n=1 Tax=Oscillatoria acuminata PCC 6304 TaxID=56110 RepID=K9TPK0_9CYAN|nr:glycerol-3-phosphate 1-O-acyltransferase PlsY [Oscillatoria acuminata]AFY84096.1 acyl-phosphate glycerol-3-phosphate acyltransferase [Oscillatoria acuminata PCC 6304]